jgi:hypothetical protein
LKSAHISPFYEPHLTPVGGRAILILWAPLGFRATCYYYRGAYYKAFFMNPPACAVTGYTSKNFRGESKFPFTIMNLHRFFLIFALALNVFLWIGAIKSYRYDGEWAIGLGSIILTANAFLLMMYSFSCHSLRHIVGGRLDCFSCARTQKAAWDKVSDYNEHHKRWAWMSLFSVAIADIYIRLVASGVVTDPNTWSAPLRVIH